MPINHKFVRNHSILWIKPVHDAVQNLKSSNLNGLNVAKYFDDNDTKIQLLQELEACNKVAFIEQDMTTRKWELILRQKGVTKISVGKELLIQKYIGYALIGWFPNLY